jgi:hypothetical protein
MKLTREIERFVEGCHPDQPYPEKLLLLQTPDGFNNLVQHIYQSTEKVERLCYLDAEEYFFYLFGRNRYEDYNSYKSSYHQVKSRLRMKKRNQFQALPMFPEYEHYKLHVAGS